MITLGSLLAMRGIRFKCMLFINMYSIKIAAKLVKIKQLYKKIKEQLSDFIVLSTYYLTFRLQ